MYCHNTLFHSVCKSQWLNWVQAHVRFTNWKWAYKQSMYKTFIAGGTRESLLVVRQGPKKLLHWYKLSLSLCCDELDEGWGRTIPVFCPVKQLATERRKTHVKPFSFCESTSDLTWLQTQVESTDWSLHSAYSSCSWECPEWHWGRYNMHVTVSIATNTTAVCHEVVFP